MRQLLHLVGTHPQFQPARLRLVEHRQQSIKHHTVVGDIITVVFEERLVQPLQSILIHRLTRRSHATLNQVHRPVTHKSPQLCHRNRVPSNQPKYVVCRRMQIRRSVHQGSIEVENQGLQGHVVTRFWLVGFQALPVLDPAQQIWSRSWISVKPRRSPTY